MSNIINYDIFSISSHNLITYLAYFNSLPVQDDFTDPL